MAPVTWSRSALVPASPDVVFRWMSDFRDDDHARPAFKRGAGVKEDGKPGSKRTVLSRDGNVVRLRDEWGRRRFDLTVTLDERSRSVTIDGEHGYRSVWRAVAEGAGTRVNASTTLAPRGLFGLVAPLFAGSFRKGLDQDFAGHIADLEESTKGA